MTKNTPYTAILKKQIRTHYSNIKSFIVAWIQTRAPLVLTKLEVKASVLLQPGLVLCSHFLPPLCCAADCLSARLPVCLSVGGQGLFAFFQHIHIHDGSGSLHVEMCVYVCVCACVCVQDLIGLWSEGILHTESQVEREQGSHCSEHYAFSIVSFHLLLVHIGAPAATAQDAFSSG